jgi:outer membrane immunogenic protein
MISTKFGSVRWEYSMRRVLLAAVMFTTVSCAQAADMPDFLRGSFPAAPVTRNWGGWYIGGQVDYSSAHIDLTHSAQSMVSFILRNTVIQQPVSQLGLFQAQHAQSPGFGGFVGRNWQWDDVVLGVEANYVYLNNLSTSAQNSIARRFDNPGGQTLPPNHTDEFRVSLTGAASLQIKDVATFRGRAGWATGNFLPYMFGGLAVGRLAVSRSVTVTANEFDIFNGVDIFGNPIQTTTQISSLSMSQAEQRGNNITAGWTGGLGTEMMLFGNVFARVEWEYVRFLTVKNMTSDMNSVHAGIGYKF